MKKTIAFYMGYSVGFNGKNYNEKNVFGSEITLLKLAESLVDYYDVYVFINIPEQEEIKYNNVNYLQLMKINNFKSFDILVILRYINYFLYCKHNAEKTFIWITDSIINPMYNGDRLPYNGEILFHNIKEKINGIICLSNWQLQNVCNVINYPSNYKKYIIPNILDISYYKPNINIKTNSFIYTIDPSRGLDILIDCLIYIQKSIPDVSLTVFRANEFTDEIVLKLQNLNNISLFNKVSQQEIANKCLESEYFFYPANGPETFCNCMAEAQLYNCVCIYNNVGGLGTTVADRGLLIDYDINNKDYVEKVSEKIIDLMKNDEKKKEFLKNGHNWAKKLDVNNIKNYWLELFNS